MKRIFLFLITNIAIMLVITIIINIFGLGQVLDEQGVGLDLTSLLMLSAVVGMTAPLSRWRSPKPWLSTPLVRM